jgi:hypothetical protein
LNLRHRVANIYFCLQNIQVTDWPKFVNFLNRSRASRLDMRKLILTRGADETWLEMRSAFNRLSFVAELQFPRSSCATVSGVVAACPRLESVVASNISPKEVDLSGLAGAKCLKELSLKVTNGKMKSLGASLGSLTTMLTKLVRNIDFGLRTSQHVQCSNRPKKLTSLNLSFSPYWVWRR